MTAPEYFLGVDGGQSSTTALIGDASGRVLGRGIAGPCNHAAASEGRAKLTSAIQGCIAGACAAAGLNPAAIRFHAACLGLSGGPDDKEDLVRALVPAEKISVTNDASIALAGAMAGDDGIVVIAGTGSIALGRKGGDTARAGGWGYVFGDEGGGFDITRRALRAALAFEEGWGPATRLRASLLEAFGSRNANDLLHRFYTSEFSRPRIASFSRRVDESARQGDSIAHSVLETAAKELASNALAVRGVLFDPAEETRVSYVGGVFRSTVVLEHFRANLEAAGSNRCVPPVYGPAAGALIEAYSLARIPVSLSQVPDETA